LHSRLINDPTSNAIQRIDFPQHGSFSNAAETWIARTDANIVELRSNERSSGSRPGSTSTCFRSSMAASYNNNIVRPDVGHQKRTGSFSEEFSSPRSFGDISKVPPQLTAILDSGQTEPQRRMAADQSRLHFCMSM
jgi:hypothetical protein